MSALTHRVCCLHLTEHTLGWALQSVMPKLLTNGRKCLKELMRSILERMMAKTMRRDKAMMLELLC